MRIRQRHCRFSRPIRHFSATTTDPSRSYINDTEKQRQFHWSYMHGYMHHTLSLITTHFFVSPIRVSLSSLTVSLIIQIENCGWVETFFDQGKRLLHSRWVQSRFRGTRTMPYAYWGSECPRERAPALGENAFWSRVLDCGRETEVSRSTDKISKCLSKWSPLRGKSCHLARKRDSSSGLPFCGRIVRFWTTTNQRRPELMFDYRGKARNRRRFS